MVDTCRTVGANEEENQELQDRLDQVADLVVPKEDNSDAEEDDDEAANEDDSDDGDGADEDDE